jgi:diguanylate cyclase (GGDEF)-like protein
MGLKELNNTTSLSHRLLGGFLIIMGMVVILVLILKLIVIHKADIPCLVFYLSSFIALLVLFLLRYRRKLIAHEKALLSAEAIKTTILNSTLEGVIGVTPKLKVYFMNYSAQRLLKVTFNTKSNISLGDLIKTNSHSAKKTLINSVKESLNKGSAVKEHSEIILKDSGDKLPISYSSSPIVEQDHVVGAIIVFADNTERVAFEKKLKALALYDSLTNLPNRLHLISYLKKRIAQARRHDMRFSLCFMDINQFKAINDHYGHHIGDKALQYVANLIMSVIRENDFFARLYGDEFCLLLDGVYLQKDIDRVLEKIYKTLQKPFTFKNHSIVISLSIGVITHTDEKMPEELLVKADEAMYQQKKKM